MPITQQRMIALIDAAGDALHALQRCGDMASAALDRAEKAEAYGNRPEAAKDELANLALLLKPQLLLRQPLETLATYQAERRHFASEARQNERNAERARKRREANGQGHRPNTAPASLFDTRPLGPLLAQDATFDWTADLDKQDVAFEPDEPEVPFSLDDSGGDS